MQEQVKEFHQTFGERLRDWFAGQALMGLYAKDNTEDSTVKELAEIAYEQADAMLAERERKGGA
jgi:hypothetical protein